MSPKNQIQAQNLSQPLPFFLHENYFDLDIKLLHEIARFFASKIAKNLELKSKVTKTQYEIIRF